MKVRRAHDLCPHEVLRSVVVDDAGRALDDTERPQVDAQPVCGSARLWERLAADDGANAQVEREEVLGADFGKPRRERVGSFAHAPFHPHAAIKASAITACPRSLGWMSPLSTHVSS